MSHLAAGDTSKKLGEKKNPASLRRGNDKRGPLGAAETKHTYGLIVVNVWFYYGSTMVDIWIIYGFTMDYLWFHYGFTMDYLWIVYGFSMDYLWFHYG